ncbi:hypothetical protein ACA910_016429 [Epithemia clementina (nom. ined.)]
MQLAPPDPLRPPTLEDLVIQSTDTLRETHFDMKVPDGWSATVPVLLSPRGQPETTDLLKGCLRRGVPPALRCAIWLSNVIQAVRPHQDPKDWHSYRTLAKVQSLDHAYENLLQTMVVGENAASNTSGSNVANGNGAVLQEEDIFTITERLWKDRLIPTYGQAAGSEAYRKISGITERGEMALKRVLIALEHVLGIIDHAPMVPTLTALLLTTMSESYVFTSVREMAHDTSWFFPISKREHAGYCCAFRHVMHRLHEQTAEYLDDRGVLDVDSLHHIFRDLFVGILPLRAVQRIMDIYTLEGSKVLFRVGVALFVLYKRESAEKLVTISNAQDWWQTMKHWAHHKLFNFDVVLRKAYGVHGRAMRTQIRFPSRNILQRIIKAEEWRMQMEGDDAGGSDDDNRGFHCTPLGLANRDEQIEVSGRVMESIHPVLAKPTQIRQALASWVPITLRLTKLDLLYTTNYHGRSLDMFYSRLQNVKHSIILLEVLDEKPTTGSNDGRAIHEPIIIGMYASQAWRISNQTYGDGECFLFRASPNPKCWKWHPDPATEFDLSKDADFNSNAIMHQFMVGQAGFISMGGNADGSCGLRLNEDLTRGESSPASGFDNEPLHGGSSNSFFSIGLLEVYGLVRQIDGKAV